MQGLQRLRWALGGVCFAGLLLCATLIPLSFKFFELMYRTRPVVTNPEACPAGHLINHGRYACVSAREQIAGNSFSILIILCMLLAGAAKLLGRDRFDQSRLERALSGLMITAVVILMVFGEHVAALLTTGSLSLPVVPPG